MVDLTQGINTVMLCFLAVGGADYLLDGRFGLGKEFEKGILTCGRLLLVMAGFMVLAPLIARGLGPVVSPLFHALGVDPSILAGMLLGTTVAYYLLFALAAWLVILLVYHTVKLM